MDADQLIIDQVIYSKIGKMSPRTFINTFREVVKVNASALIIQGFPKITDPFCRSGSCNHQVRYHASCRGKVFVFRLFCKPQSTSEKSASSVHLRSHALSGSGAAKQGFGFYIAYQCFGRYAEFRQGLFYRFGNSCSVLRMGWPLGTVIITFRNHPEGKYIIYKMIVQVNQTRVYGTFSFYNYFT
ncbi:hypothetical protein D3C85_1088160 [compost metagenome]